MKENKIIIFSKIMFVKLTETVALVISTKTTNLEKALESNESCQMRAPSYYFLFVNWLKKPFQIQE